MPKYESGRVRMSSVLPRQHTLQNRAESRLVSCKQVLVLLAKLFQLSRRFVIIIGGLGKLSRRRKLDLDIGHCCVNIF